MRGERGCSSQLSIVSMRCQRAGSGRWKSLIPIPLLVRGGTLRLRQLFVIIAARPKEISHDKSAVEPLVFAASSQILNFVCCCGTDWLGSEARAAPVHFDLDTVCCSVGTTIPGTSGQPFHFTIFADNGSSSVLNQTWLSYSSATLSIGSYSASFEPTLGSAFFATTNGAGAVTSIFLTDDTINSDSLGNHPDIFLAVFALLSTGSFFASTLALPQSWTVAAVVPLPGALPLFASALGAGAFAAWRRRRAKRAVAQAG